MFTPVHHGFNAKDEVAIFLPPLKGEVTGWRPEGSTGLWISIIDQIDMPIAISEEALEKAVSNGEILFVQVSEGKNFEHMVKIVP